ncbi:MAG: M4 family metallopeptidase [Bacteroidales bacterium]
MKKLSFLIVLLNILLFSNLTNAQTILYGSDAKKIIPGTQMLVLDKNTLIPSYFKFDKNAEVRFENLDYILYQQLKFDENIAYKLLSNDRDQLGNVHYRYELTFQGHKIHDAMFIVHVNNAKIYAVNGCFNKNISLSNNIVLTENTALQQLLSKINAKKYKWQMPEEEMLLQKESLNPKATYYPKGEIVIFNDKTNKQFIYTYSFNVYSSIPLKRAVYYVNASTGEIVFENNLIHEGNANGTAVTKFSGTQPIKTDSVSPTSFRLRETYRGQGIETYNMLKGTNYGVAVDFTDTDNLWNNVNTAKDEVATDAHWGAGKTWDFFYYKFERNSIDNLGFKIKSYVHYDVNYANAFWDGQRMTYGDGNASWQPLTALDICGHEITHGLTSFTANLNYSNESGAMNEAFSDIFGTCIEFYSKPATANWLIGEDIGTPIRSMSNPGTYTQPDTYLGSSWYSGTADNGGVHTNSGVLNFWFYLLTKGGSGTNDNSQIYNVTGVGIDTAAAIAFRLLTVYLTPSSQYADARFYAIIAASDLFGACGQAVQSVSNAFYAVGIGNAFAAGVQSNFTTPNAAFCQTPANVNFTNQSNNGASYLWDFGDGTNSTLLNPTHTYNSYGTFTVKLVANGGSCGIDSITKLQYISVLPTNPCVFNMPQTGTMTATSCSGILYDNGGSSNYTDNSDILTVISPSGAASVNITFTSFNYEDGFDYLYVYNGNSTSSPLIGKYTGANLPNGGTISSTSGSLTLRQTSDAAANELGFTANWQCVFPTVPPSCNFKISDTISCNGIIDFVDLSTNGPNNWLWNFGDGSTSNSQYPSHTYLANGTYTIKLYASNAYGADSITKTNIIHINKPVDPIIPNDTAHCGATSFIFNVNGSGIKWFDSPTATLPIDTGIVHNTGVLNTSATFYVESQFSGASVFGAKPDTTGAGSYFTNTTKHYLVFDCLSPTKLKTVKISAGAAGSKVFQLQNSSGTVLATKTVTVPKGTSRVSLNFDLPVQNDLRLAGPASPNLYRNSGGTAYPYTVGPNINIKYSSNSQNPTASYYYFYDWEIEGEACHSNRLAINAFISTAAPSPSFTFSSNSLNVSFNNTSTQGNTYLWNFGDGNTSSQVNPTHNYSNYGTYTVKLIVINACGTDSVSNAVDVIVSVNENKLSNMTIYPNPTNDKLYIQLPSLTTDKLKLQLLSITGQLIWSNTYETTESGFNTTIDIKNFAKGIYYLRVQQENQLIVKKIIKL